MSDQLPKVVSESTLTIGASTLRVTQLDNGTRVIDADDLDKFFVAGGLPDQLTEAWQTDTERELARVTAERDVLKAACETLLACDREKDLGAGLALLHEAVEQARAALKLCEVQQ